TKRIDDDAIRSRDLRSPSVALIKHESPQRSETRAPHTSNTAAMPSERDYQISPIVQESVMHNTKTLSNLQSLSASLFGVAAGILGLESYNGFLFYLIFSFITAGLFYILRIAPESTSAGLPFLSTSRYFKGPFDFWTSGLLGGLSGFILTWTLFYGLVRA
ncbi:hypothetical protein CORC01_03401, partial [Colletotrichum orchidophilum]